MSLLSSSRRTSRATFDRWGSFYDRSRIIKHVTRSWDENVIKLSPPTPLLDLGCGPGRLANRLISAGYDSIFGLDISRTCLLMARKKIGGGDFHPVQGIIEKIPYKDASFSSAVFSGVIHHLENPSEALSEVARVLKSGGRLIIIEPRFVFGLRQIINLVLDVYPFNGDRRFYTPQTLTRLAERRGFVQKNMLECPFSYILVFERC